MKNALFITCRDATYLHSKKQESKLRGSERLGLWLHLLFCRFCALFFKQLDGLQQAAHQCGATEVHTLRPAAKATLQAALDKARAK